MENLKIGQYKPIGRYKNLSQVEKTELYSELLLVKKKNEKAYKEAKRSMVKFHFTVSLIYVAGLWVAGFLKLNVLFMINSIFLIIYLLQAMHGIGAIDGIYGTYVRDINLNIEETMIP